MEYFNAMPNCKFRDVYLLRFELWLLCHLEIAKITS